MLSIKKIRVLEKTYNYRAPQDAHALADIAYEEKDFRSFFRSHKTHANKGDVYSQFKLGWAHEHGLGTPKDRGKAEKWYLTAAQQGHEDAQYRLGIFYGKERAMHAGVHFDTFWYERASVNGHVEAAYRLAEAYERGLGVPKDQQEASMWFEFASTP